MATTAHTSLSSSSSLSSGNRHGSNAGRVGGRRLLICLAFGFCLCVFVVVNQQMTSMMNLSSNMLLTAGSHGHHFDALFMMMATTTTTTTATVPTTIAATIPTACNTTTTTTTSTTKIVVDISKRPPYILHCGIRGNGRTEAASGLQDILPEYQFKNLSFPRTWSTKERSKWYYDMVHNKTQHSGDVVVVDDGAMREYDIFFAAIDILCQDARLERWIHRHFRGQVLYITGEDEPPPANLDQRPALLYLGNVPENYHERAMRFYYLQWTWWHIWHKMQGNDLLLYPDQKPQGTREFFLIYAANNCVPFRSQALEALSQLSLAPTHAGGRCMGTKKTKTEDAGRDGGGDGQDGQQPQQRYNITRITTSVKLSNWWDNTQLYRRYRFCLVMEHSQKEGYVTEKILVAYLGGCLPIYYGPTTIVDLFNPKSFIFYDIYNPQPALERVAYLEHNATAYDEVMKEPILAAGNVTIEKYFSLDDSIGGGKLKYEIRRRLGLDKYQFITSNSSNSSNNNKNQPTMTTATTAAVVR